MSESNTDRGAANRRRTLVKTVARLAISVGFLGLAIRLALPGDGRALLPSLLGAWSAPLPTSLAWFALGSSAYLIATALAAVRFTVLLQAADLAGRWPVVFRAYLIANFMGLALPSAVVGDAYRFADARRDSGRGAEVFGSLVLERLLGLAALCSVGLLAAPFIPASETGTQWAWALVAASATLFAVAIGCFHPLGRRLARAAVEGVGRLSPRLGQETQRVLTALAHLSSRPRLVGEVFALSLACQAIPVLGVWALAMPLDSHVPAFWFPVIVPFVMAVSLLPISLGGTGVRESLYVVLFGIAGMRPEVALSLSLSILAANLVWGLAGLALLARGRRPAL
ncbi:flippase-like domain-containing protein [Myxococcota bacterium]|nr:flippase-like domain-containing protein [Myxococcota bacterium]